MGGGNIMAYIWEKYSADKMFVSGKIVCPYIEIFSDSVNRIEVNPLIRFSELFELLHSEEIKNIINNSDVSDNILYHYLAQLDKCKGLTYKQRIIEALRNELKAGYFGDKAKVLWSDLDFADKDTVLYLLADRLLHDGNSYFMEAISKLYKLSSLCYEEKTDTYYLYVGEEESEYNVNKYELIKVLFWTINKKIKPVWTNHYGIIGIADTMRINSIQIV